VVNVSNEQADAEQWFRAADKDADGRLDVPEVHGFIE
jgi:hypothetical protein